MRGSRDFAIPPSLRRDPGPEGTVQQKERRLELPLRQPRRAFQAHQPQANVSTSPASLNSATHPRSLGTTISSSVYEWEYHPQFSTAKGATEIRARRSTIHDVVFWCLYRQKLMSRSNGPSHRKHCSRWTIFEHPFLNEPPALSSGPYPISFPDIKSPFGNR